MEGRQCQECEPGRFSSETGRSTCDSCMSILLLSPLMSCEASSSNKLIGSDGEYQPGIMQTFCIECTSGRQHTIISMPCVLTKNQIGSYALGLNQTICTQCSTGMECKGKGRNSMTCFFLLFQQSHLLIDPTILVNTWVWPVYNSTTKTTTLRNVPCTRGRCKGGEYIFRNLTRYKGCWSHLRY